MHEQRQHSRIPDCRRGKLFSPRGERYYSFEARDISAGGVLIETSRVLPLKPGDAIRVGIPVESEEPGQGGWPNLPWAKQGGDRGFGVFRSGWGLMRASDMVEATVVRTLRADDGGMHLGLQFHETQGGLVPRAVAA